MKEYSVDNMINKSKVRIVKADITKIRADAIVNTANIRPICGNGVDRAIFRAAGEKELTLEREKNKKYMHRAEVFVTDSYKLKEHGVRYIFHTLSTFWINGKFKEEEILRDCYRNCLDKARELFCKSIAFPIIGSGSFGFPLGTAMKIAHEECWDFADTIEGLTIYLVVFGNEMESFCQRFTDSVKKDISDDEVQQGILDEYLFEDKNFDEIVIPDNVSTLMAIGNVPLLLAGNKLFKNNKNTYIESSVINTYEQAPQYKKVKMLLDHYFKYGMKMKLYEDEPTVYKRISMPRNTFSDIMNQRNRSMPSKVTLLKMIIGLQVDIYSAEILLETAGCPFIKSDITDQIIKNSIIKYEYDYDKICHEILEKDKDSLFIK